MERNVSGQIVSEHGIAIRIFIVYSPVLTGKYGLFSVEPVVRVNRVEYLVALRTEDHLVEVRTFLLVGYQVEFIWECAIGIIVTIPFVTFTVLSGLQSIDDAYYEAATVDGAGFWSKLRHVTIPLVKPSLTVSTVLNIIYVFNSFPIIYTITKGAPANKTDTMVTYLYMLAFYDQRKGPATALSVIGFAILCVASGVYMLITMRKEEGGL